MAAFVGWIIHVFYKVDLADGESEFAQLWIVRWFTGNLSFVVVLLFCFCFFLFDIDPCVVGFTKTKNKKQKPENLFLFVVELQEKRVTIQEGSIPGSRVKQTFYK